MCDPLSIGGAVLSGASMAINAANEGSAARARESAMNAERDRQAALERERAALVDKGRDRYTGFEGQQADSAKRLGDYFQTQATPAPPAEIAPGAPGAGNVAVTQEIANQRSKVGRYGQQQNQALGGLRAFGDVLGDIGVKQARDTGTIGQLNGFSKGSSAVLPLELEAANNKRGSGLFGDVLNLGGRVALGAGLAGMGPSFGGPDAWTRVTYKGVSGGGASP